MKLRWVLLGAVLVAGVLVAVVVTDRTPLRTENGTAVAPVGPGFGIEWNEAALARVTVKDA